MRLLAVVVVAVLNVLVVAAHEHPIARSTHLVALRSPQDEPDTPSVSPPAPIVNGGDANNTDTTNTGGKGDTGDTGGVSDVGTNAPSGQPDPPTNATQTPPAAVTTAPPLAVSNDTVTTTPAVPTTTTPNGNLGNGGIIGGVGGIVTSVVGGIGDVASTVLGGITSALPPVSQTASPTTPTQPVVTGPPSTNTTDSDQPTITTDPPVQTNPPVETDPPANTTTSTTTSAQGGVIPIITTILGPITTLLPPLPLPGPNTTTSEDDPPATSTNGTIGTTAQPDPPTLTLPTVTLPTVTLPTITLPTDTDTTTPPPITDTTTPPQNTDTTTPPQNTDTTTPTITNPPPGPTGNSTTTDTDTNTSITFPGNNTDTSTNTGVTTDTTTTSTSTVITVAPGLSFILTETTLALAPLPTTTTDDVTLTDPDQATTTVDPTLLPVASAPPTLTIAPLPTGIPNQIIPRDQPVYSSSDLVGFTLISILFNQQLNWPFVVGNTLASSQILGLVPVLISSALNIDQSNVKTLRLQVFFPTSYNGPEDQDQLGTIWLGYIPSDLVDDLSAYIKAKQSKFYTGAPEGIARDLANRVQSGYPLLSVTDPNSGAVAGNGVGPGGATSAVSDNSKSRQDAIIGVVTALGAIALMVLVFLVYRSMKRKRQLAHRRLSDPPDTTYAGYRPEGREFDEDSVGGQRRRSFYFAEDSLRGYQAENNHTTDNFDHNTPFRASVGQGQMSQRRNAGPVAISAPILRESSMNW